MVGASDGETADIQAVLLAHIEDLRLYLRSIQAEQRTVTQLQPSASSYLRPEVQKFIAACETIQGLLASGAQLTSDEIGVIEMSGQELLSKVTDDSSGGAMLH